jgi:hypothetical protein
MFSKPKLSTVVAIPSPNELQRALKVALKNYGEAKRFKDATQNKVVDPPTKILWSYIYMKSACKVSCTSNGGLQLHVVCAYCTRSVPIHLRLSKFGWKGFLLTKLHNHVRGKHMHKNIVTRSEEVEHQHLKGYKEVLVEHSQHHVTRTWTKSLTANVLDALRCAGATPWKLCLSSEDREVLRNISGNKVRQRRLRSDAISHHNGRLGFRIPYESIPKEILRKLISRELKTVLERYLKSGDAYIASITILFVPKNSTAQKPHRDFDLGKCLSVCLAFDLDSSKHIGELLYLFEPRTFFACRPII